MGRKLAEFSGTAFAERERNLSRATCTFHPTPYLLPLTAGWTENFPDPPPEERKSSFASFPFETVIFSSTPQLLFTVSPTGSVLDKSSRKVDRHHDRSTSHRRQPCSFSQMYLAIPARHGPTISRPSDFYRH